MKDDLDRTGMKKRQKFAALECATGCTVFPGSAMVVYVLDRLLNGCT